MKKNISLILSLALILSIFTACGQTPASTSETTAAPSTAAVSSAVAATDAPTVKQPVTIRVMMQGRVEGPISNDLTFIQEIVDKANINFEWETSPADGSQYTEKFNILIASQNIPDLMIHGDKNILNNGGSNGVFEDLKPLIASSMPNVVNLMADRPGMERDITTDDGHIYYLPRLTAVKPFNMMLVRQDIMEKENLAVPQTTEDMYNLLKFLKDYDLNGNGEKDEIPWTTRNKFGGFSCFFEPFGVYLGDDFFIGDDGKVSYTFANPGFKQGLEYTSKLYAEELIDLEFSTNDIKVWDSRISNHISAMTWDTFSRVDYVNNLVQKTDSNAIFASIPPVANQNGEHVSREQQNKYGHGTAVSTKSEYKAEIAEFINWIHSDEGNAVLNYGVEGETYKVENGVYEYTDLIMKDPNTTAMTMLFSNGWRDMWPYRTDMGYENAMNSDYQNAVRDGFTQYIKGDRYPTTLTYTEDERQIINTKYQEVKTYKDEMVYKFVMGIEPMSKYEEYLSNLDKIGLQDVLAVQQAAYDRYTRR